MKGVRSPSHSLPIGARPSRHWPTGCCIPTPSTTCLRTGRARQSQAAVTLLGSGPITTCSTAWAEAKRGRPRARLGAQLQGWLGALGARRSRHRHRRRSPSSRRTSRTQRRWVCTRSGENTPFNFGCTAPPGPQSKERARRPRTPGCSSCRTWAAKPFSAGPDRRHRRRRGGGGGQRPRCRAWGNPAKAAPPPPGPRLTEGEKQAELKKQQDAQKEKEEKEQREKEEKAKKEREEKEKKDKEEKDEEVRQPGRRHRRAVDDAVAAPGRGEAQSDQAAGRTPTAAHRDPRSTRRPRRLGSGESIRPSPTSTASRGPGSSARSAPPRSRSRRSTTCAGTSRCTSTTLRWAERRRTPAGRCREPPHPRRRCALQMRQRLIRRSRRRLPASGSGR